MPIGWLAVGAGLTVLLVGLVVFLLVRRRSRKAGYLKSDVYFNTGVDVYTGETAEGRGGYFQGMASDNPTISVHQRRLPSLVLQEQNTGRVTRVQLGGPVALGRGAPSVQAEICAVSADSSVSKSHCRVYLYNGSVYVEDTGSANGSKLGGVPLAGPTVLQPGAQLTLGRAVFTVSIEDLKT